MVRDGGAVWRELVSALEEELPGAVELRRALHATPEPGGAEVRTSALLADELPVAARSLDGTTNLVARVGARGPGVLVRAELDGVELAERTGVPYAATGGRMHACGHDVHCAALVALARAAHRLRDRLPAPLLAVFQASEERTPSGAEVVLCDAELKDDVRAAVGVHVHPGIPWGHLGADPGAVNAATYGFEITVEGSAGHGAYPHTTRDPVLALAQIVVALHTLTGRRVDPVHPAALSVCALSAGAGDNVIPDRASALGTLRTLHEDDHLPMREAVRTTVAQVAAAHGCTGTVRAHRDEPALVNDLALTGALRDAARAAGVPLAAPWRSCGGDDFARYGTSWPALMVFVGLLDAPGFAPAPLHSPVFLPPDEAVREVARAQALGYLAAAGTPNPRTGRAP
ncbi:M20 family metallopeptidase [Streptomyces sp. NPDC090306]|uniref:M20 metallopeptidase family protein n=1 Tax=Streptomyces sp. NPDC090306 TaxID=3365961 RepID=UPI0037FA8CFC